MANDSRLLDVAATAVYLGGISTDSVRGLVASGVLMPVRVPSSRCPGESSRRLLFDRDDLDRVIDEWKRRSSSAPHPGLSAAAVEGWRRSPTRTRRTQRVAR